LRPIQRVQSGQPVQPQHYPPRPPLLRQRGQCHQLDLPRPLRPLAPLQCYPHPMDQLDRPVQLVLLVQPQHYQRLRGRSARLVQQGLLRHYPHRQRPESLGHPYRLLHPAALLQCCLHQLVQSGRCCQWGLSRHRPQPGQYRQPVQRPRSDQRPRSGQRHHRHQQGQPVQHRSGLQTAPPRLSSNGSLLAGRLSALTCRADQRVLECLQ